MKRRVVKVGALAFGGGDVFVQSMLNIPPDDIDGNIAQALRLVKVGCEVIRVAVPTLPDVKLVSALKTQLPNIPVVADIHFDYKIAIESVFAGADKIRINPGNIGDVGKVKAVADACRNADIPIRVGVNGGSAVKGIVESAIEHIRLLERFDFNNIVVSVKSSSVRETIAAYRELAELTPYPLHLGVTEAGTERTGLVKSAIGIGSLLCDGIGDTIRASLTAEPEREVEAAIDILKATGIRKGVEIISCPTCGRCRIDVISIAQQVEKRTRNLDKPLRIGVMGCAVNGPGECKEADLGITGGDGEGLIFKRGEIVRKVKETDLIDELMEEIGGF